MIGTDIIKYYKNSHLKGKGKHLKIPLRETVSLRKILDWR